MSFALRRSCSALVLTLAGWLSGVTLQSSLAGTASWELNGNLGSSTGNLALEAVGYPGVAGAPAVTFTTDLIGGVTAQVAQLSEGTALVVRHGFPNNGGGAYLNNYTIIMDVKFPDAIDWTSLYQTNEAYDDGLGQFDLSDSNDGDWFVEPSGGLGIESNYGGTVVSGTWYRLALVVNLQAGTYTTYINGVQVQQNTGKGVDGRYALYTTTDPDPYDWFLLFADETGAAEMSAVTLASFQFRDVAATAQEIADLGGPTALGIGIVAPTCEQGYFSDDFNGYADDAALLAAGWQVVQANAPLEDALWTLSNPAARRNPPTSDGSPSTGKFVISDSDDAGGGNTPGTGMSHDLITPAFSTAGGSTVWVQADVSAQLNNDAGNATAVFDVDVSTDGGATWTNAFRRVAPNRTIAPIADTTNSDGFFGRLSVDITAQAADKPSVQVRFRHFEPTDDWWVALDDVFVSCVGPPVPGSCVLLSSQDFSAGLGAMKAVSLVGNTGNETWSTGDKGNRYAAGVVGGSSGRGVNRINQPNAAKEFVILEGRTPPNPAEDEYLATPVLDCSRFTKIILSFKSETVTDNDVTEEVLASIDGGVTFPIVIFRYNQGGNSGASGLFDDREEPFYAKRAFSVDSVVGQSQVVFAFHYQSPAIANEYWALDDIQVSGEVPICDPRDCGLRAFTAAYDPSTNRVLGSWNLLPGDTGFRVIEGARVVADLPATATSFVDTAPPAGGVAVDYKLVCLVAAGVDRECPAPSVSTFACPGRLASRVDQKAKTVKLSWKPGVNLNATGYDIRRNGSVIATVGLGVSTFTDTPPLGAGKVGVYSYELEVAGNDAGKCATPITRAVVSSGQVCFADDFEDYADDVAFELGGYFRVDEVVTPPGENATWTITNPGERANPPTFDGQPSSGQFAISDSDYADGDNGAPGNGNSNDLWSPSFSTLGKSAVWLHMDTSAQLNDNGKVVFDVDVSTDGGGTWTNTYRRVAPQRTEAAPIVDRTNADGYFGRLDVNLTALAADEPDVRFRLRSFEPSDDWWVAVDNVIVDDLPPLSGGAVTVFEEDFEAGITHMSVVSAIDPPNTGAATWTAADPCARNNGGVQGRGVNRINAKFAIMDSGCDPDPPANEYLVTPALDCSLLSEVFLHYESEIDAVDVAEQEVLVSLDGGTTFEEEPIFSYNVGGLLDSGEEPFYARRVFSVASAAGQSSVVFAFHYEGPGNEVYWAVDNVQVTGTSVCKSPFVVSIAGTSTATSGSTVHLTSSTDATAPATHAWEVTSGSGTVQGSSTGTEVDILGSASGDVVVKLTVKDRCGAQRSATHTVNFTPAGGRQKPNDENQDGKMDISDAVAVLNYLFTGTNPSLPCASGDKGDPANIALLDANGDGKVDLSDPVRLLESLFLSLDAVPSNCLTATCSCIVIPNCPENALCP